MLRSRIAILLATVAWVFLVGAAFASLIGDSLVPGRPGEAPLAWPAASTLVRDPRHATLVIAIHPRCPCSRATLGELEQIMMRCQGRLSARVLFVRPPELALAWAMTDVYRSARSIPGVTAVIDSAGAECERFGAFTSGQAALYDASGRLAFSGGITGARGHAGANAGENAVVAAVSSDVPAPATAPVYGCPLWKAPGRKKPTKERRACPAS